MENMWGSCPCKANDPPHAKERKEFLVSTTFHPLLFEEAWNLTCGFCYHMITLNSTWIKTHTHTDSAVADYFSLWNCILLYLAELHFSPRKESFFGGLWLVLSETL